MGYLKIRMPAQKKTSPKGDYTALELRRVGFSAKDLKQGRRVTVVWKLEISLVTFF